MPNLSSRRLASFVAVLAGLAQTTSAAEILIVDAKSQPESLTVAPGGILFVGSASTPFVGSASTPFVYKVRPSSTTAEKFVDPSAEGAGTFFFVYLRRRYQQTHLPDHRSLRGRQIQPAPRRLAPYFL